MGTDKYLTQTDGKLKQDGLVFWGRTNTGHKQTESCNGTDRRTEAQTDGQTKSIALYLARLKKRIFSKKSYYPLFFF